MKLFVVCLIALVGIAACEQYTVKYDNVDLKEILNSDRLLKNYFDCVMDKKTCPPDGAELKRVLPDALKTECAKCSEKQKEGSKQVIRHIYKNKKDWWKQLEAKYDPEGTYAKKYHDELEKL